MDHLIEPRFIHDCDHCTFLGHFEKDGMPVDLYYHAKDYPSLADLLARYGDEPWEYASSHPPEGFADGVMPRPWEVETVRRAKEAGIYVQPQPAKKMILCKCGEREIFTAKDEYYCSLRCSLGDV